MPAPKRNNYIWGKYQVITLEKNDGVHAAAFVAKKKNKEVVGPNEEAALDLLRNSLRQIELEREGKRNNGVPTSEEYAEALLAVEAETHDAQWTMLIAHYHAYNPYTVLKMTFTATELAKAGGYKNWSSANLHYGKLGRKVGEFLNFKPLLADEQGDPVWTSVIATGKKFGGVGGWIWTLRPEVAEALISRGRVKRIATYPDPKPLDLADIELGSLS